MEKNDMKNIVMLKDLPSNLVEEAIIILKANKKIKKAEQITSNTKIVPKDVENDANKYIVKEAEMLIANYIAKLENPQKTQKDTENLKVKYNRVKKYSFIITILLFISIILNLI